MNRHQLHKSHDNTSLHVSELSGEDQNDVRDCLKIEKQGGGYIPSTDHSIHDGMQYDNVMAYLDAGRKYGAY